MESRDLAHGDRPFEPRAQCTILHLSPTNFVPRVDGEFRAYSPPSSPGSAATHSPVTPLAPPTHCQPSVSESRKRDPLQEPASVSHRTRSPPVCANKTEKEKRKRSRVTPEQLVHLERFFSVDRSPTAARRREISELLGMQERQTQIWFQNRRAKAKLQDGKHKPRSGSTETPPDTPPELSTGFEVDLFNLIHEDEPVTVIPCTDLSIGTWRRIATTIGKHDLVAYVCETKRCVTWFIHSGGYGFKMEIPFEIILETEFANAAPGTGLATFVLSRPPTFYLESISSRSDGPILREWKRCADWTEGHQATKVLRHDLIGSAVQLAHLLRNLQADTPVSDADLPSPTYNANTESPTEFPQLPAAGVRRHQFDHPGYSGAPEYPLSGRKRSYSGPPVISHLSSFDTSPLPSSIQSPAQHSIPSAPYSSSGFQHMPTPGSSNFSSPLISEYTESEGQHSFLHHLEPSSFDYPVAMSQCVMPRPYSAQPVPRTFYDDDGGFILSREDMLRRHASHPYVITPSPPPSYVATSYHPTMGSINSGQHDRLTSASPVISGLPGEPCEPDDHQKNSS